MPLTYRGIHSLILVGACALTACTRPSDGATPSPAPTVTPSPTPTVSPTPTPKPRPPIVRLPSEFGPPDATLPTLAFGDCNEDGLLDVLITQKHERLLIRQPDGTLKSQLVLKDHRSVPDGYSTQEGDFADLDGDGHLDLVLVGTNAPDLFNGGVMLRGHGDCTFDPPSPLLDLTDDHVPMIGQVNVTDVDLDGVSDITFLYKKEKERLLRVLLGRGDGHFIDAGIPATPFLSLRDYLPFGMFWDDVDGDGVRDLLASVDLGGAWFSWGVPGLLPTYTRDDRLSKLLSDVHAMGVVPLDADRDGVLDYFVSGLYQQNLLFRGGSRTMENWADAAGLNRADTVRAYKAWGSYVFDAELDGWPDLLVIRTFDPESGVGVDPGPPVFFHNLGGGQFDTESNIKSKELWTDARHMWCGDMRSDGHVQCYVRTNIGEFPILRPDANQVGKWVGVQLRGTVSSPEAEGARVSLVAANPPVLLYYGEASPTEAHHDRRVLIPIGDQPEAALDIEWPSGLVQRVEHLTAGAYHTIEEPKLLRVSTRVAPADGQTTVLVSVDGSLTHNVVSIEREGAGEWEGPLEQSLSGDWIRRLRAPSEAGLARIVVKLGDTTLKVRPRLTFVPAE